MVSSFCTDFLLFMILYYMILCLEFFNTQSHSGSEFRQIPLRTHSLHIETKLSNLLLHHFHGLRLNGVSWPTAGVFPAAACEAAGRPDIHIVIAHDLTAQANAA